jgi:nitroimidazol reductase NimA-like FMN-containing flavoprotein (pyridoxamine 5'-phosphate oxidase superfamily)
MVDQENMPYIVPLNFGVKDEVIYLHSSGTGKKIDILKQNKNICIAFSTDHQLRFQHETVACSYGMKYRSVLVYGHIEFIEDGDEKIKAMNVVMLKYTGKEFSFNAPAIREVCVYRVVITDMTGKKLGY